MGAYGFVKALEYFSDRLYFGEVDIISSNIQEIFQKFKMATNSLLHIIKI